jgi:hypothetical protein
VRYGVSREDKQAAAAAAAVVVVVAVVLVIGIVQVNIHTLVVFLNWPQSASTAYREKCSLLTQPVPVLASAFYCMPYQTSFTLLLGDLT